MKSIRVPAFLNPFAAGVAAALLLPTGPVAIGAAVLTSPNPAQASFENSPKAVLDEAWQIVYREYVDTSFNRVDWLAVRQELLGRDYSSPEAAYDELKRALRRLEDPYTRFLEPEQYASLTEQTSGEVSGIGLQLRREPSSGDIFVLDLLPDSPAQQAGIQAGDQILMIDGRSTENLTVEGVSQLIRGEQGSQVTVTLKRSQTGQQDTMILTREQLQVAAVTSELQQQGNVQVGYIRLTEFSAHAAEQMQSAISRLSAQGAEAFVLDLRGNPGGLLHASIDIGRMLLPRGTIVSTVYRDGHSEVISANRTDITNLPLAVLVNGQSASSSEILTGALRDHNRAVVVGNPTFGKALVQSLHGLPDGSGIAVTVAHYYTPAGTDISQQGITPDVEISLTDDQQQALSRNPTLLGTAADPQFVQAVRALEPVVAQRQQAAATAPLSPPVQQLGQQLGHN
ncbi:S41 family peptidase [Romeria aff. gracilis LEGE 07310]|uniref:S41 family peptidase n=1 Tax=Vasconcelosia minhoensis LEGE 07310 TaxID=915328 RepID=A0A8J7DMC2_9CYAN|nr:S41 family peptidase [Romeria gracilis]MBE9078486.1 S41 family peptidase [Romeria aff. gracilis LEGE 07310]